jgi:hypothetical protein
MEDTPDENCSPDEYVYSPEENEKEEKIRDGFMDFYVNTQLKWSIEMVREADKLGEHLGRYILEGRYVPYLKAVPLFYIFLY